MSTLVIIGTQFGDEGKGKIVDYLSEKFDIVVRFQGGNNAGHTVVVGDKTYKFHILPSGVVREKIVVLGNGMVIDPKVLLSEMEELKKQGINYELKISGRAHVILPFHVDEDALEEKLKGKLMTGTTKKGIGPTYKDKFARFGIRMIDLLDENVLKNKLEFLIELKQSFFESHGSKLERSLPDVLNEYLEYGNILREYIIDTSIYLNKAIDNGTKVIFEGAQGFYLDIDFGTYPYVTSSHTCVGGVSVGSGVPPKKIDKVVGIMKAYTTRVGEGVFPTELKDEMGEHIRDKGNEYGTTTGRPRRVGWLDLVLMRYCIMMNGIDSIAITKLDTLCDLDSIKVAYAYKLDGKIIEYPPSSQEDYKRIEVLYKEFPGWNEWSDEDKEKFINDGYNSLSSNAREYIKYLTEELKTPIEIISFGQKRNHTLFL